MKNGQRLNLKRTGCTAVNKEILRRKKLLGEKWCVLEKLDLTDRVLEKGITLGRLSL